MANKLKIASPMQAPFPQPSVEGDKRDVEDQNPHEPTAHDRSKDTLPLHFYEGLDTGKYIGKVDEVAEDVLSSPMNGQRRSATGERESPKSVTQA